MKKPLSHVAPLLVLLLFPASIFAQNPEREPLFFQTYSIEDGLSGNDIGDITQDQQGYLWIATGSGVSRFDGYEFEIFRNDPSDSSTLSSNDSYAIHTDRKNNVWVATTNGINRFDRASATFRRYSIDEPYDSFFNRQVEAPVNKFFESQDGRLYISTTGGLAIFDEEQQAFRMIRAGDDDGSALSHPEVTSIAESADGRIWIGTYGGGVNILDPETGTISYLRHDPDNVNSPPNDYIINLFIDRDQVLWINYDHRENRLGYFFHDNSSSGSWSGLWKKDLNSGRGQHYLYNPEKGHPGWSFVTDFVQTRDGKIWMAQILVDSAGLRLFDNDEDIFWDYSYDANNPGSIPWNYVTALHEDQSGNLWVGTSRGLARADQTQLRMSAFTPVPGEMYNDSNLFQGIEAVGENQFLISSVVYNIHWNRNTNTWKRLTDTNPSLLPVIYDNNDHVWLLTLENTIERIHLETYETQEYDVIETVAGSVTFLKHFLRLSDDLLLVATSNGLFELIPASGQFKKIDLLLPSGAAKDPAIEYLTADSTGKVWLGINNASLDDSNSNRGILIARYDPGTGQTVFPEFNDSYLAALDNGSLNHLMIDSRGWVWVSKSNGLVRLDPETNQATFYTEQDGLQNLKILGTVEDDLGMIWISTEFGISRLNPETDSIRNYNRNDGLRPSRLNPHTFYKRSNGELMFGGVGGLSYFNPEDIRESHDPPHINVVSMETEDATTNLTDRGASEVPIQIHWDSNSINLEFVSINFRNPEQTTYAYKLEGFHNDWVDAGTRRFAQFSNLPPKSYTFLVRAVNAYGITSAEAASVSFTVLPPLYRTWWAYGFYLILLIAGIVTADRIQRRRVQQKEREKAREKELAQAREIEKAYQNLEAAHKDLEQAHSNLKSAQEQLVQQEKLASLGQLTAGIAHEIKNPLNFVNNFSEVSTEMIEELVEAMKIGDLEEAEDLARDISQNLKKIHEHGSRADSIVKSMLQHSRGGSGIMEPTDLNALVKEYVNLAFHGMRAGKEAINVDIDLQLDEDIGEVPLTAEDFSRVILNLVNNAFDAMRDKLTEDGGPETGYMPKLTIRTKSDDGKVMIEIEDNGPGIPDEIKDNILQPFFTTKKGTAGTGLGLSITNDIVKAHGGSIDVHSEPGQTVFNIKLNG